MIVAHDSSYREELRAKFVAAEKTLFRIRWEEEDRFGQQDFINSLNLNFQPVRNRSLLSQLEADFPTNNFR